MVKISAEQRERAVLAGEPRKYADFSGNDPAWLDYQECWLSSFDPDHPLPPRGQWKERASHWKKVTRQYHTISGRSQNVVHSNAASSSPVTQPAAALREPLGTLPSQPGQMASLQSLPAPKPLMESQVAALCACTCMYMHVFAREASPPRTSVGACALTGTSACHPCRSRPARRSQRAARWEARRAAVGWDR